jgi:hypothetical protein
MNGTPEIQTCEDAQNVNPFIGIGKKGRNKCPSCGGLKCQDAIRCACCRRKEYALRRICSKCGGVKGLRGSLCDKCHRKAFVEKFTTKEWYKKRKVVHTVEGNKIRSVRMQKEKNPGWRGGVKYCEDNYIAIRERKKERHRDFQRENRESPVFRLHQNIGGGIRSSLRAGEKKGRKWESLVGYGMMEIKKHLEKQFIDGMTWENYGRYGWHIDHIIPISAFNIEAPEDYDFKRCWSLKNLRPLWAKENLSKNDKIEGVFQPCLL